MCLQSPSCSFSSFRRADDSCNFSCFMVLCQALLASKLPCSMKVCYSESAQPGTHTNSCSPVCTCSLHMRRSYNVRIVCRRRPGQAAAGAGEGDTHISRQQRLHHAHAIQQLPAWPPGHPQGPRHRHRPQPRTPLPPAAGNQPILPQHLSSAANSCCYHGTLRAFVVTHAINWSSCCTTKCEISLVVSSFGSGQHSVQICSKL